MLESIEGLRLTYPLQSLLVVVLFSLVHVFANKAKGVHSAFHSRLLSTGSGVAIAYVFLDILPKLSKNDAVVKSSFEHVFPYFERHVYVMALLGFLLFFIVDRSKEIVSSKSAYFYLSLGSYALFNFLVGYAVVDKDNPEVQPLVLFTIAMLLHYFMNDYSLTEEHGRQYDCFAKWMLIVCLCAGWGVGLVMQLSATAVALVSAFIGGGVIMNVTRHELPKNKPHSLDAFLVAAFVYAVILLSIG